MPPPSGTHSPAAPLPACALSIQEAATGITQLRAGMARTHGHGAGRRPWGLCPAALHRKHYQGQPVCVRFPGDCRRGTGRGRSLGSNTTCTAPGTEHTGGLSSSGHISPTSRRWHCSSDRGGVTELMQGRAGTRTLECLQRLCPWPPRMPPLVPSLSHARPCLFLSKPGLPPLPNGLELSEGLPQC